MKTLTTTALLMFLSIALLGCGQKLLCYHESIATDRVNHLIQIGDIFLTDQKDACPTGALKRLDHDFALFVGKMFDLVPVARDQSFRSHFLGEQLEI